MDIGSLHFQNPEAFWLLLFVPLLIALYVYRQQRRKSTIKFPALALAKKAVPSRRVKFRHIVPALRLAALTCFVVALARPQNAMEVEYTSTDGVDIMLALDVSGSMGTLDMLTRTEQAKLGVMNAERILKKGEYWKYSRLGYAQDVIADFIRKRHSDRIGLSAFGSRSFTQCPLTLDYGSLLEILKATDDLARDSVVNNRTAIGDGLMNALARLKLVYNGCELVSEIYRDYCRRRLVSAEPVVITRRCNGNTQNIGIIIYRLYYRSQKQQELHIMLRLLARL